MRYFYNIFFLFICWSSGAQNITTVAGTGVAGYSGDGGPASAATLQFPFGLNFDKSGNLYVAEGSNNSTIRKINSGGIISTFAGTGSPGYSGDGGQATLAQLNIPTGVCADDSGNIFIAEQQNYRVRKVDKFGIITTYAGTGINGYNGDGIPANTAQLGTPSGVIIDNQGNLLITEFFNNRIRKVDQAGVISTIAGTGTVGYSGDGGPAMLANLNRPYGITIDDSNNIYFADCDNNCIRKIDASGIISTVAGTGLQGYSGDGGTAVLANLDHPSTVVVDKNGNIYIADWYNHVIRKIDTLGIITTVAGSGTQGYSGDGGPATSAQLNYPFGVAVDTACCLYVADDMNNVIRKVTNVVGIKKPSSSVRRQLIVSPNPNSGEFTIEMQGKGKKLVVEIYNFYGQLIHNREHDMTSEQEVKISNLSEGVYLVKLIVDGIQHKTGRIIVTK